MSNYSRSQNDRATTDRREITDRTVADNRIRNDQLTEERRERQDKAMAENRLRNDERTSDRRDAKDGNFGTILAVSLIALIILGMGVYFFIG